MASVLSPRAFLGFVIAGLTGAAVGVYPGAVRALVHDGGMSPGPAGWSVVRSAEGVLRVLDVDPDGPAAGHLLPGDRLVTLNGYPPLPTGLGWVSFIDLRESDRYALSVDRGGVPLAFPLLMQRRTSARTLWLVQIPLLFVSLLFCASGGVVALLRPADGVARRYATLGILVGVAIIPFGVFPSQAWRGLDRGVLAATRALGPLVPPVAYQFFAAFPPGVPLALIWSRLRIALYLWSSILLPGAVATAVVTSRSGATAARLIDQHRRFFEMHDALSSAFIPLALAATVAVIVRNHLAVEDVSQRRRFRLVLWGSIFGTAPFALVNAADGLLGISHRVDYATWVSVQGVAELLLVLLPVTFAYAVVEHRVIGIDVVVRRSLRYLLARHVLQAAVSLPLLVLIARAASNPDRTLTQILFESPFSVVLAMASGVALSARARIRGWLDRRFFREAYDGELVLLDLVDEIKHHATPDDLAPLVSQRLERALHPRDTRVYFIDPDGGGLRLAHASATDDGIDLEPFGQSSWLHNLEQRAAAEDIGSSLAVPIGGGGRRMYGLLLLGPKRSEQPYSREDRRLILAVASQMAIVCENSSLRLDAAHDAQIRHDVLAHVEASGINLLTECPACGRCYDRTQERCDADGTVVALTLPVDRTIDRKYRLDRLLGRGGMASVYLASDLRLGRDIAVKIMKSSRTGAQDSRRFEREARTSARLRHPHIITVHDYGSIGHEMGYLVMERLVVTTFREELRSAGRLAPGIAAVLFDQILDAVSFAHAAGVIHRDLKPENIFICNGPRERTVKVLDFGLAKLTATDATTSVNLTEAGTIMGTLAYMSPEQLAGHPIDQRTDIFALGVMLFETLTGRNPFQRNEQMAAVAAILHERPRIVGETPEIRQLDAVVQRCCAKNAAERFGTVDEMREALLPALHACGSLDTIMGLS